MANQQTSVPTFTPQDLQDPTEFKLNKTIAFIYNKLGLLYGAGGNVTLGANLTVPSLALTTGSTVPTDLSDVLTLGAAEQLFQLKAGVTSVSTAGPAGPAGPPGPPAPTIPGVVLEASQYCGGGGLTQACINNAISALPSTGGAIHCKTGTWNLSGSVYCNKPNVMIYGDGIGTLMNVTGTMATGYGVFDITSAGVTLWNFQINGQVTSPTGLQYGTAPPGGFNVIDPETGSLADIPTAYTLTNNSSVWVHGGANNFLATQLMVTQTAGYSVFFDATATNITNGQVSWCLFYNNVPNTFGNSPGLLNYGSWTGGVLYAGGTYKGGTGTLSYVSGLKISNNTFYKVYGNCVWGWSPQLTILNDKIVVTNNHFQDTGLDGTNIGASQNGAVSGNTYYRVGYIAGSPAYLSGTPAVAMDTSGFVRGFTYSNNTVYNVNGEGIDLDGFTDGTVYGNSISNSSPSDYYYTADQVASYGATKGIQNGSTYDIRGGKNIAITGNTIRNASYNSIVLFNNRNSTVTGNTIYHPASAGGVPILLANNTLSGTCSTSGSTVTWASGAQFDTNLNGTYTSGLWLDSGYVYININGITYQILNVASATSLTVSPAVGTFTGAFTVGKLQNNTVTSNQIFYTGANVCIFEDNTYGNVYGPNFVYDNRAIGPGNYGEVGLGTATGNLSKTTFVLGTNYPFNPGSPNPLSQAIFQREGIGSTAGTKIYSNVSGVGTQLWQISDVGPVMNVSSNGAANTGAITTANRSALSTLVDFIYSGKTIVDGYGVYGMYNNNTSFYDTEANSLTDSYGMIRYRRLGAVGTGGIFEASTSTSGGARVWATISTGSAAVAGSDTQVQYNLGGTSFGADGNFTWSYTTPTQVLTIMGGTATGTCNTSGTAVTWVSGNTFVAGMAGQSIKIGSTVYTVSTYNSSTSLTLTSSAGTNTGATFHAAIAYGGIVVTDNNLTDGLPAHSVYVQSDGGFVTSNANSNAIQAPNGGVSSKWGTVTDSIFWIQETAPALSGSGQTRMYMDSGTHLLMASQNGGAYEPVITSGSVAGSDTQIQYNKSSAFGADGNLIWYYNTGSTPPYQQMVITGKTGVAAYAALVVTDSNSPHTAYIESDGGFYSTNTNGNTVSIPNGGVTASTVSATSSSWNALQNSNGGAAAAAFYPAANSSHPSNPGSGYGGIGFDTGTTYWIYNGTADTWTTVNLGGISVAGSDTDIQYNKAGAFGADGNLIWYYNTGSTPPYQQMVITGKTGVAAYPALVVTDSNTPHTAYIESDGGFITANANSNAIQALNGGVEALQLMAYNTAGSGTAATVYAQSTNADAFSVFELVNDNHSYQVAAGGSTSGKNFFYIYDVTNSAVRLMIETGGPVLVNTTTDDGSGAQVQVNGFISANTGFYTVSSAATAIQAPNGTITSKDMTATDTAVNAIQTSGGVQVNKAIYMEALAAAPTNPQSGYGGIYRTTTASTYGYWTGSAWATIDFATIPTSVVGSGSGISVTTSSGTVTISNTGVTSLAAGSGISVSASTGAVTVTNSGVTALTGTANEVIVSASTGSVTLSTPQAIGTSSSPTFSALTLTSSATNALNVTGGIDCSAIAASSSAYNAIQTAGGLSIRTGSASVNDLTSEGSVVINSSHVFVGEGIDTPSYGHTAAGFNPYVGGTQYTGATGPYTCTWSGGFTIGATTYHNLEFAGGVLVGIS